MNLRFPEKRGSFTSYATIRFLKRTVLHRVSYFMTEFLSEFANKLAVHKRALRNFAIPRLTNQKWSYTLLAPNASAVASSAPEINVCGTGMWRPPGRVLVLDTIAITSQE
jgi:hypothetical protein